MYCPNCGTQVPKSARFCPECGTGLAKQPGGPARPAKTTAGSAKARQNIGAVQGDAAAVGAVDSGGGPVTVGGQHHHGDAIHTGGGGYVGGDLRVGRDYIGRDQVVYGDLIVVSTLSELDTVDPATRRRLMQAYEAQTRRSPQAARYHLALGLSYLDLGLYAEAIASLRQALARAPQDANALYYLALAHVGGRELRTLAWSEVKTIEGYLEAAIRLDDSRAHTLYFWALLKYEYYLHNGFAVTPPQIDDLLSLASRATYVRGEISHLLRHAPAPDSPLTEAILARR